MEVEHETQRVMAFVQSVTQKEHWRSVMGFVMFTTDGLSTELEQIGACIGDFLDIGDSLDPNRPYPAFMTWEGSVQFIEDDCITDGKWRRSTGHEVIAASQGRNPFTTPAPEDAPVVA